MKILGPSVLLGVLLASIIIYILHPLNGGSIAFVTVICVSLSALIIAPFRKKKKDSHDS